MKQETESGFLPVVAFCLPLNLHQNEAKILVVNLKESKVNIIWNSGGVLL